MEKKSILVGGSESALARAAVWPTMKMRLGSRVSRAGVPGSVSDSHFLPVSALRWGRGSSGSTQNIMAGT